MEGFFADSACRHSRLLYGGGHPPPPTATMNRARLILNARGKDTKRARLNKEPPTIFSLYKVKGQSIMSCSLHR